MNAITGSVTQPVSLDDKYMACEGRVYMSGIQALVRIALDRGRLDRAVGLDTGGFISGYRGSPLAGFDKELERAGRPLKEYDVVFQPGVNEELGATAVWGTQKVSMHGQGSTKDGVFGIWYGKAPGVDRAGDALRQASASGTDPNGGVLALAGDDHLAKSSIIPAQSEFFFQHAEIPVFNPADIQDVLDYGLHGLELSRYSGLWAGMICLADTMDASGIVSVDENRLRFVHPPLLEGADLGDRHKPLLLKYRLEVERVMRDARLPAVQAYARANGLDGIRFGADYPRLGLVATGKAYRDLRQALQLLGIDEARAKAMGLAIHKVAVPWPLEPEGLSQFARGIDRLLVVEHKRAFMEPQIKDLFYNWPADRRPPVWGKKTPEGDPFLPDVLELSVADLVVALTAFLPEAYVTDDMRQVAAGMVRQAQWAASHAEGAVRSPYFCSGCPHSTSTKVPEGSRVMPGIGCHAMTEINERTTEGQIAMGGEGVPWVGQAPFAKDKHIFANLGDGTYFHSGILAIRQSVAANVPITYKILFNDAVAMTGGQTHDGPLDVPTLARQLASEGVGRIMVVSERPELYEGRRDLAAGVPVHDRAELMDVQAELAAYPGVSAMVYDQTCAAEKRRRRKKGLYEDPDKRLFINDRVCEGCGDCSVQSNCLSVEPVATDFGEKRRINQSSCNKDFSCVKGFCPSFVWVEGAELKKSDGGDVDLDALVAALPDVAPAELDETVNMLIAGIGGMGVTTVAAVLAMAGHVDGINVSTLDMTGLAQKGGPVTSHVRFSDRERPVEGPRVPTATLDVLLASDMVVSCGAEVLTLMNPEKIRVFANAHVAPTAEFVMKQTLSFDEARMMATLKKASRGVTARDVAGIAEKLLGDAIYTNMMLVGMAWQSGALPLSFEAIDTAIRLNGAAVSRNLRAFQAGRVLAHYPDALMAGLPKEDVPEDMDPETRIAFLSAELARYQDAAYAARFTELAERVVKADKARGIGAMRLSRTIIDNLYKVMAIKDEYEVARLYAEPDFRRKLMNTFADPKKVKVMLAPPLFSRIDPATGRAEKTAFGPWVFKAFGLLAGMKGLRGTVFDPFARTEERKAEFALREQYVRDVELILQRIESGHYGLLVEFARVPDLIRGYGPVKDANMAKAAEKRDMLLKRLDGDGPIVRGDGPRPAFLEAAE
ncbi:indolepyruvate ferredoxin oxidoreductase family protein [Breoghania sp.]|uniref:indolepyruvate ferredoxin oxidoreductase family protein n=1 Tax=Breoghania sp. TaxID=2065378 RepID=UPI002638EE32|nr:indolepyruvate ferredoxin oxidoreductase family protein [Breoghania sp.]MDJ0932021.1 indolepyruvate ferredoxin oxidoreductase family protein [Breoghania sp.]